MNLKLGGRVGRRSWRTSMRPRRASGVPHSSSASRTTRIGSCALIAAVYNVSRSRMSNLVFRLDGPRSPLSFNWLTRDSAIVWLNTDREYAMDCKTLSGWLLSRRKNMWQPSWRLLWYFPDTVVAIVLFPVPAAPINKSTFGYPLASTHWYILRKVSFLVFSRHSGRLSPAKFEGFNLSFNSN